MGGGEFAILNLLKGIDRERFHPIMAFNRRGEFVDRVEAIGVETAILPYPTVMLKRLLSPSVAREAIRASKEIRSFMMTNRIDVVHTTDVLGLLLMGRGIFGMRIPVFYNVIFFYEWERVLLFNVLARLLVTKIITNSRAIREDLRDRTMFLGDRFGTIYYGFDTDVYRPLHAGEENLFRSRFGVPGGMRIVAMAGRFDTWKGHITFLNAAERILARRDDVRFFVIGGLFHDTVNPELRRYYDSVMECHRTLQLGEKLRFIPHQQDMPEILRGLDILVCPSHREPIPLILFEGMASGLPVIGADSGGIPEQIENEDSGLLFRTGNAADLAACIIRYLDSPEECCRAGIRARERVMQHFSLGRYVREIESTYLELLGEHRS
jgi:glycosyltransferase involved in cell wall biosynthesis